ncbi:MAG: hypothetical protein C4320_00870, partial [Armatimonadota bacterium]
MPSVFERTSPSADSESGLIDAHVHVVAGLADLGKNAALPDVLDRENLLGEEVGARFQPLRLGAGEGGGKRAIAGLRENAEALGEDLRNGEDANEEDHDDHQHLDQRGPAVPRRTEEARTGRGPRHQVHGVTRQA